MNESKNNVPAANIGGHKLKNDLVFIAVLLLAVVLVGLGIYFLRGEGDSVTVTVDGRLYGVYSLSEDLTLDIRTGDDGEERNLLIIKDGKAYVQSATCPDGICASHKPISREGESIVCLPNRVVITVTTEQKDDAPDVVV
ncbi:MAG: NusG domain II-containing protein [Ruminococcaceae bacterium]|nr:NusG domain II-containing protein [Oscillospiraceae bacterium]